MAYTIVKNVNVFGNQRAIHMDITADAATQTIEPGLSKIYGVAYTPCSMNTSNIHISPNSGALNTALFGFIGVTGCTSGDHFFITVFGV